MQTETVIEASTPSGSLNGGEVVGVFSSLVEGSEVPWSPRDSIPLRGFWRQPGLLRAQGIPLDGSFLARSAYPAKLAKPPSGRDVLLSPFFEGLPGRPIDDLIADLGGDNALAHVLSNPVAAAAQLGFSSVQAQTLERRVALLAPFIHDFTLMMELGLNRRSAAQLIIRHREDGMAYLTRDPYQTLIALGVDFDATDRAALAIGVDLDSSERIMAAFNLRLKAAGRRGDTALRGRETVRAVHAMLRRSVPIEDIRSILYSGPLRERLSDGAARVVTARQDAMDRAMAQHLSRLSEPRIEPVPLADAEMLSDEQASAVRLMLDHPVSVLTGGPGTGKTFTVRALCESLAKAGTPPVFVACTGKAARRLSESVQRPASTVHALLGLSAEGYRPKHDSYAPLDGRPLILDEASMLDCGLLLRLLDALPTGARLYLVGDPKQLPPVDSGAPFADLIDSGVIPVASLKTVHRSAAESTLTQAAMAVREGMLPDLTLRDLDGFFWLPEGFNYAQRRIVDAVCRIIPDALRINPEDVQVLSARKAGPLGVHALNRVLQSELRDTSGRSFSANDRGAYYTGDRIVWMNNDRHLDLTNGSTGVIVDFDRTSGLVHADFDVGSRDLRFSAFSQGRVELAYALTVHRSQGSEYPAVVVPVVEQHRPTRDLIYTAMTRAEQTAYLVGDRRAFRDGVKTGLRRSRNSPSRGSPALQCHQRTKERRADARRLALTRFFSYHFCGSVSGTCSFPTGSTKPSKTIGGTTHFATSSPPPSRPC